MSATGRSALDQVRDVGSAKTGFQGRLIAFAAFLDHGRFRGVSGRRDGGVLAAALASPDEGQGNRKKNHQSEDNAQKMQRQTGGRGDRPDQATEREGDGEPHGNEPE